MNKDLNICFFNSCKTWGGGEKWHHDIAIRLKSLGYNVVVCTNTVSELKCKLEGNNIPFSQFGIGNLSFLNPFLVYKAYRFFKTNHIDTVILGLPSDVKAAGIAAKLAGVRKIIYRRGTALPVKNSFLNRFLYRRVVTDIIANSLEIKQKFLEKNPNLCPSSRIHIIYNGVDIPSFVNPFDNFQNRRLVLGNAGRLVEQKGQKFLIDLAVVLKRMVPEFSILIAGKGELEDSLKEYARHCGVEEYIFFLDFVPDMDSFFKRIDLFLLPSLHEGSANIVLEAMSYGKPVIAFDISSMGEMVRHGDTGYLVNFGDMKSFADRIFYLFSHKSVCRDMGENARNYVRSNFTIKNCLQHLMQVIYPAEMIDTSLLKLNYPYEPGLVTDKTTQNVSVD